MNHMELPSLETERLVIRPFMLDDLDDLYRIIDCDCFGSRSPNDETAKRRRKDWLEWNRLGDEQQARLGHPPYGDRAVTLKSDGRVIGVCGLVSSFGPFRRLMDGDDSYSLNSSELGLFYAIASGHRRQGFATEAAVARVTKHGSSPAIWRGSMRPKEGRHLAAEVPDLPFDADSFDLAVCSHFLFLYSEQLSAGFHIDSIRSLIRVAKEVRIFPLLELGATSYRIGDDGAA